MRWVKVIAYVRSCRVTTETGRSFFCSNFAPQRVFQRIRHARRMIRRYGNAQIAEKTYAGFLEIALVFKQKTLSPAAAAKYPSYRRRKCPSISSDRVRHRTILFCQAVMKWANVVCGFSAREFRFRGRNRGVCHRVLLLPGCESGMTLGADLRAYVIISGSVTFARPPSGFGQMFVATELLAYGCRYLRPSRRKKHTSKRTQNGKLSHG